MALLRQAVVLFLVAFVAAPSAYNLAFCEEKKPLTPEEEKEVEAIKDELQQLETKLASSKTSRNTVTKVDAALSKKKEDPSAKTSAHSGKLEIGGLIQVWYTAFQRDSRGAFDDPANGIADTNTASDNSSFLARRAELSFKYKPNGYVTAYVMIDAAREAITHPLITDNQAQANGIFKQNNNIAEELDDDGTGNAAGLGNFFTTRIAQRGLGTPARLLQDAYINFHMDANCPGDFDWHHDFQIGQFVVPFGEEGLRSSAQLDFAERSFVGILGHNRDMGAQIHGTWWNDRLQYWGGVFNGAQDYHMSNGQGNNRSDTNDAKDFAFRFLIRPLDSECLGHMELGVSGEFGLHGEGGGTDPIVTPVNNFGRTNTWASRYDAWLYYAASGPLDGFWLRGEWGWFKDRNAPGTVVDFTGNGGTDYDNTGSGSGLAQSNGRAFAVSGWYGAAGYRFNHTPFCVPKFMKNMELAYRYQTFQNVITADLINPAYTDVFSTVVHTAGINYYIKDSLAKVQINYNKVIDPVSNTPGRNIRAVRNDSFVVNFQVAF